ncbi:hypothetical protein VPNG_02839 [Cytospora leucostoma]|uniref:CREG-like beta-barrel domain-containing protein n=1 Tax=Cytospora leucostoma TaxID=1230097 RepID=A0A423XJA9_9PEZI|nr:hypothetical protein VPNG_02839 [Cytospora leucostoma]
MKLTTSLSAIAALSTAAATPTSFSSPELPESPRNLFANPPPHRPLDTKEQPSSQQQSPLRIPTSYESAVLGRRILALTPLATLSTVFPSDHSSSTTITTAAAEGEGEGEDDAHALEHRPQDVGGVPIGLVDYIADCGPEEEGNPTILAIKIATSFRNVAAGSNLSIGVNWVPPYPPAKRIKSHRSSLATRLRRWLGWDQEDDNNDDDDDNNHRDPVPYSAANLPRFSLLGHLEDITPSSEAEARALQSCFLGYHPDARYWLPGNPIHAAAWARLVVTHVYWVGGFGDRAYIGWIPAEEWRDVTRAEWEGVRLPGERKGWREWGVGGGAEGLGDEL